MEPTCAIWTDPSEARFARDLVLIDRVADSSHAMRAIMICRDCGQFWVYEYLDDTDWSGSGYDPSWRTWSAAPDLAAARAIAARPGALPEPRVCADQDAGERVARIFRVAPVREG